MIEECVDETPENPHFGRYLGTYVVREKAREAFRDHWRESLPKVDQWSVDAIDEAIWHGF